MSKYVRETAAAKSVSAWVITKGARHVATVQAHFGDSRVLVNIWQEPEAYKACKFKRGETITQEGARAAHDLYAFQAGTASGYGYDKLTAALAGLMIDGHALTDHCGARLKAPKGNGGLWPRDAKAPKGYSFANWTRASKATGQTMHAYTWNDKARAEMGLPDDGRQITDAQFLAMSERADALKAAWEASDDFATGYSSCYRLEGLKFLEAIGYTVRQAL